jgi:Cu-processing system ATP-binding protein
MIEVQSLTKKFGKLKALDNLSVSLEKGQAVSLIGPNGSGKTTFIKCLLGMVIPDSGSIEFAGKNIAKDWHYRQLIGYMPQIGRYPDNMQIGQLFEMMKDIRKSLPTPGGGAITPLSFGEGLGVRLSPPSGELEGASGVGGLDEELVSAFELKTIFHKKMRTLSGGTRQKVSACLAFLFNPPVLILDEPTAGLDPLASEILKEKIQQEKSKGKLILLTSHILSDLDELTTDIMYLIDGKLQFFRSLEDLKAITNEDKLGKAIAKLMKSPLAPGGGTNNSEIFTPSLSGRAGEGL